MTVLLARQRLVIGRNGSEGTRQRLVLDAKTDAIRLRIARPTAARPGLNFGLGSRIATRILVRAGTEDFLCTGSATGGQRIGIIEDIAEYSLLYRLPWGYFGTTDFAARRLGEEKTSLDVLVELLLDGDPVDTEWIIESSEAPAPTVVPRNSVTWDATTDAQETSGDGVLSLSHTAAGSDRAAFAGSGNSSSSQGELSTSTTYGGNSMSEQWDIKSSYTRSAGYTLAGDASIAASAQTVTNTLAAGVDEHYLTVTTMAGVDSGTPVGTAATSTGTTTSPSVTVASLATDGLIVDIIYNADTSNPSNTAGANQTQRSTESIAINVSAASSTQSSNDGGVMSWSVGDAPGYGQCLGAIEFKPTAGGGGGSNFGSRPLLTLGVGA